MPYTVQKKAAGDKTWTEVGKRESLDDAIVLATATEKHASADQSREFDVSARVLDGRRVIWK